MEGPELYFEVFGIKDVLIIKKYIYNAKYNKFH